MTAKTARPSVILVAERTGHSGGGEAIKAQQYADHLRAQGVELRVITAAASRISQGLDVPGDMLWMVEDSRLQQLLWAVPPLRPFLGVYFQLKARALIRADTRPGPKPVVHYISPVSPVAPRFPLKGYRNILGPVTGNIYYPPGFRARMPWGARAREGLHGLAQVLFGRLLGDKRRFATVLVSGYERTRASLRVAGVPEARMVDVVDAGVSDRLAARLRIAHAGANGAFMCSGRLVDHKGIDLAIRAVAGAGAGVTLDIYGDGPERPRLERLVAALDLRERVTFHGWLTDHDALIAEFARYRGYILPSLAEANGIVMQEAMMAGLPVVALRWGGPAMLADDASALYVVPESDAQVVRDMAAAMDLLAGDGALAERISQAARARAEAHFTWEAVAASWQAASGGAEARRDAERLAG